jgi:uncharacterized protein YqgC (DUF456 family)
MDLTWDIVASLLMVGGVVGCIVPFLPGPPLSYAGLLILQLKEDPPFSVQFLVIWAVIVIVVSVLDYLVPIYGTKKLGGSKYGMWGCTIGLIAGFWLGPIGIIAGPFAGAFIGELLANSNSEQALKAAIGSFIGFVFSTLLKLVTCLVMAWYFVKAL